MAATEVPIPLVALAVGSHDYGPAPVDDDVHLATITVDRTATRPAADGLNGQPSSTRVDLEVWQSNDAGVSWQFRAAAGLIGGLYPANDAGDPFLASTISVELAPGTGRRVRATVRVAGARVAVAGTLTIV
jgi:hypothetical protein